jgi:hypothetical protein
MHLVFCCSSECRDFQKDQYGHVDCLQTFFCVSFASKCSSFPTRCSILPRQRAGIATLHMTLTQRGGYIIFASNTNSSCRLSETDFADLTYFSRMVEEKRSVTHGHTPQKMIYLGYRQFTCLTIFSNGRTYKLRHVLQRYP